ATLRQRDELLPVSAPVHVLGRCKQPPADTRQYVEAEAVERSLTPAARARTDGATASLFIEPDRSNHRGCRRSLLPQHVLEHGCEAIASERPAFLRDGRAHVPIAGARRLLALQRRRIELELGDFDRFARPILELPRLQLALERRLRMLRLDGIRRTQQVR